MTKKFGSTITQAVRSNMLRDTTLFYSGVDHVIDKRFAVGNRSALDDDDVTICCSDLFANNRPITRNSLTAFTASCWMGCAA